MTDRIKIDDSLSSDLDALYRRAETERDAVLHGRGAPRHGRGRSDVGRVSRIDGVGNKKCLTWQRTGAY
ncbi:hypothetical protein [Streptomyces sp. NPDC016845]|uniref:hypothetical protein n=1 Tax=Streptomyces sp. NPDC016845 TaxID=3364972 RepID=UPI0037A2BE6B